MTDNRSSTYGEFQKLVNLTAQELEDWLNTTESKSVGIVKGTSREKIKNPQKQESIGHESGRMIVELLHMDEEEYTDEDYAHMKKVIGYIRRHEAQGPVKSDVTTSRWRYSLMNWGHDPLKRETS